MLKASLHQAALSQSNGDITDKQIAHSNCEKRLEII